MLAEAHPTAILAAVANLPMLADACTTALLAVVASLPMLAEATKLPLWHLLLRWHILLWVS